MNLHDLLSHHGMSANPFADEDAQTDPVFQGRCRTSTFHPNWDKVYGNAGEVILNGLKQYVQEVSTTEFPEPERYFGMKDEEYDELLDLLD